MGKSKNKKKKSSSKASYDAKKKTEKTYAAKSSENTVKKEDLEVIKDNESIEDTVAAEIVETTDTEIVSPSPENTEAQNTEKAPECECVPPMAVVPEVEIPYDPAFSEEDFALSVNTLKAEDIHMPEGKNDVTDKKPVKKISAASNIIQIALLCICASVALVCIFMLGKNIWGKVKGQELYSNTHFDGFTLEDTGKNDSRFLAYIGSDAPLMTLFDRINAGKSSVSEDTSGKYSQQLAQMKASLSALKAKNPDVYGWIYVEGTNINHPVVRCGDNNYYLDHAYTGEYLPIGAIFADLTTADLITDNYNTVIYGHNVVSSGQSSMFHDVEKFLDFEFFSNANIYIYTMDGAFVFKPVAIYDTVADYFYFRTVFSNEESFLGFAEEMLSNSNFNTGESFASGDRMLTLSTCTNGAQDGRYALHAKLIEIIK